MKATELQSLDLKIKLLTVEMTENIKTSPTASYL